MNFENLNHNPTPEEYLHKFKTPHEVISLRQSPEQENRDREIIEEILMKSYDDNNQSEATKEKVIKELKEIISTWMLNTTHNDKQENTHNDKLKTAQNEKQEIDLEKQKIDLEKLGYGLKIFGSYSLRANSIDGDIDMICIVPHYFSREKHFFGTLTEALKQNENFKEVFPIPDAMVPLIRLNIYDIQIDLLISIISPTFLTANPNFFEGEIKTKDHQIKQRELRSVNGYRTSLYLRKTIKSYKNYQLALKAIKMWAKNKGIYSQIYGYLGGAAFSILLAKICQLYPNYSPLQLLDRFFYIYASWIWSEPVKIQNVNCDDQTDSLMTVYSPLEPHMNAAHSITKVSYAVTRKQFILASKTIQQINKNKKKWSDLFEPINFFKLYRNFIEISVMGDKTEDFLSWKGSIESKFRKFIKSLDYLVESTQGFQINPYPHAFTSKHSNYKYCFKYYIGFKCSQNSPINDYFEIDLTQPVKSFLELIENYSGIEKVPKQLNIGFTQTMQDQISPETIRSLRLYELE